MDQLLKAEEDKERALKEAKASSKGDKVEAE